MEDTNLNKKVDKWLVVL